MTSQEQQLIDGLIERIRSTQVTDKDIAAEQHLQQGLAGYPDALYVLAQTVIVQQYGLQQAQSQIQQAQSQVTDLQAQLDDLRQHPAPAQNSGGSFLGHLFGTSAQQVPTQNPPYQVVSNPGYNYGSPGYTSPIDSQSAYRQPIGISPTGGGFLRGALQTAAGVAAGEMAFASIESLFHGFGGGGGYGSGFGGNGFSEGRPEEVVNNYYGDGVEHRGEHLTDAVSDDDGLQNDGFGNNVSSDRFVDREPANSEAFDASEDNSSLDSFDSGSDDSGIDAGDSSDYGGDDQS